MCGRFTLRTPPGQLVTAFMLDAAPELFPRFNIAPTQKVAVVRNSPTGSRELARLHWGLVPSWATDRSIGNRMINARAETVAEKPAFRSAFRQRRCLVVADGYYEWQKTGGKTKRPHHIHLRDGRPFGMAGLWERWEQGGQPLESCTIITTEANDLTRPIHDRMPAIIQPESYDLWLAPSAESSATLQELLRPCAADEMEIVALSTTVNNPRNEGPQCLERPETLFQ